MAMARRPLLTVAVLVLAVACRASTKDKEGTHKPNDVAADHHAAAAVQPAGKTPDSTTTVGRPTSSTRFLHRTARASRPVAASNPLLSPRSVPHQARLQQEAMEMQRQMHFRSKSRAMAEQTALQQQMLAVRQ